MYNKDITKKKEEKKMTRNEFTVTAIGKGFYRTKTFATFNEAHKYFSNLLKYHTTNCNNARWTIAETQANGIAKVYHI